MYSLSSVFCFFFLFKLSVAVCIGFFAAWSPYAVVSMWAAFGEIENIPPLAFAMPAMFAKSSTIYNPIIYLMLRPSFRRIMCRDLGTLFQTCMKGCLMFRGQAKCCSKPNIRLRHRTVHRQNNQLPLSISSTQPPIVPLKDLRCQRCMDNFECFRHYPQMCGIANSVANTSSLNDQETPVLQIFNEMCESEPPKKSMMATVRTSDTNYFNVSLEMVPKYTEEAWP